MGFEDCYEVSNEGNVRSLPRTTSQKLNLLKQNMSNRYLAVGLCKNGQVKQKRIHVLVAEAFLPNPTNKPIVEHLNDIRTDNKLGNLRWATQKENLNTARSFGSMVPPPRHVGESHPGAKLTEEQVMEIRSLRENTGLPYYKIGELFGVATQTVFQIIKRHAWKHI